MVAARNDSLRVPGVTVLWAMLGLVAAEIVVTYSRIPSEKLYAVSGSGLGAGFGRALVFLNFPVALAALPVVALSAERLRRTWLPAAVAAAGLCSVVFWPGVVDQYDLDARPVNALPAVGVALAVVLSYAAGLHREQVRLCALALPLLVGLYLGLEIAYGLANTAQDGWLEQVAKRGWTTHVIPSVLRPALTLAWLGIALAAAV